MLYEPRCVLCGQEATVKEVEPLEEWLAVEGCACGDFRVWAGMWNARLANLSAEDRWEISSRLRQQPRHPGGRVQLVTQDSKVSGPIVIETRGPGDPIS